MRRRAEHSRFIVGLTVVSISGRCLMVLPIGQQHLELWNVSVDCYVVNDVIENNASAIVTRFHRLDNRLNSSFVMPK